MAAPVSPEGPSAWDMAHSLWLLLEHTVTGTPHTSHGRAVRDLTFDVSKDSFRIGADWYFLFATGLVMFIWNFFSRKIVEWVTGTFLLPVTKDGSKPSSKQLKGHHSRVEKFAQSVMEAIIYGGFGFLGIALIQHEWWRWPSIVWWRGVEAGEHAEMSIELKAFYLFYWSRYANTLLFVVLFEHRRKDFGQMCAHHVVTLLTIIFSYLSTLTRAGSLVMVMLDVAEPALHLAKLFKYMEDTRNPSNTSTKIYSVVKDVLFYIFGISFFVTRIVMYSYLLWSAWFERERGGPNTFVGDMGTCCACFLLGLQCYWFVLIIKVATRKAATGNVEDVRSDEEDKED